MGFYRAISSMVLRKFFSLFFGLIFSIHAMAQDGLSKELQDLYFIKARFLVEKYLNNYPETKDKNEALKILDMLEENDYEGDAEDPDDIRDFINDFEQKQEKLIFTNKFFISLAYMTWNNNLILINDQGTPFELTSTVQGYCLGGGIKWHNSNYEMNLKSCLAIAEATVAENSRSIEYRQNGVSVEAIFISPGFLWTPASRVALGFNLPLMYHRGNYGIPAGTAIKNSKEFSLGYEIEGQYKLKYFDLATTIGKIAGLPGALWGFKLLYQF